MLEFFRDHHFFFKNQRVSERDSLKSKIKDFEPPIYFSHHISFNNPPPKKIFEQKEALQSESLTKASDLNSKSLSLKIFEKCLVGSS